LSPRRKLNYTADELPATESWMLAAESFMEHEEDEARLTDFQACRTAIIEKRRQFLANA
jgi:hypothetical protein